MTNRHDTSPFARHSAARPVTLPVELGPRLHRQLAAWCHNTAEALDVRALARSDVIEALLEYLVEDDTASAAIQARLATKMRGPRHDHT